MGLFAAQADVVIANEEDIQLGLGFRVPGVDHGAKLDDGAYKALAEALVLKHPNIGIVAVTLRESQSADRNDWSACLLGKDGFRRSRSYELCDIVDRVGGGDSFAAGLICALLDGLDEAAALEFAVAAAALKHTIPGDWNLVSRAEVDRLVAGDGTGRVQR
jgi:2-dehydro-3-deoxygluconokinase